MNEIRDELETLEKQSLKRSLRTVESAASARVSVGDKSLINFSSNNYVGLARHPRVIQAAQDAIDQWGTGATSSRLVSGTFSVHETLEKTLARFMQKDSALVFPSGYMANLGVVTALVASGDAVIVDRLCHASLLDAVRLSGARLFVYPHADVDRARALLERTQSYRRRLLITESIFSMDGDFAPLRALVDLSRAYGALSMVDEAHALGVWGFHGRGVLGMEGMDVPWDIVVGTLSKSLGSQGGFVAGSDDLIQLLVNRARSFIFTTGLSPASAAAAQAALEMIEADPGPRVAVQKLSNRLRDGLRGQGWNIAGSSSQIVPIVVGSPEAALGLATHLRENGIFVPAIRPPAVHAGQCRLRLSVTSEHSEDDIRQVLEALDPLAPTMASAGHAVAR